MDPPSRARQLALWLPATVIVLLLGFLRWHNASSTPIGTDFGYTLSAAHDVASGRSPYLVKQYVYPPLLALVFVPFVHASATLLWKVWLGIMVAAPLVGVGAFLTLVRGPRSWWLRPVAFAVCSASIYDHRYYPVSRELLLGQADTIVFPLLVLVAVSASGGRARSRGIFAGLAGLVKVWPWVAAFGVAQRGTPNRRRTLLWALATALLAPIMAAALGWSALGGFFRNTFDARQQRLVSDSVWDIPRLMFRSTGLVRPLTISPWLQLALTVVLAVWVVAILVVALRTHDNGALGAWNVLFCVILLLPVAHRQYALFVLPLAWWWVLQAVEGPRRRRLAMFVAAVLALWWLDQTVTWPYDGSSNHLTVLLYCVPFLADLLALTTSVLGARSLGAAVPAPLTPRPARWRR